MIYCQLHDVQNWFSFNFRNQLFKIPYERSAHLCHMDISSKVRQGGVAHLLSLYIVPVVVGHDDPLDIKNIDSFADQMRKEWRGLQWKREVETDSTWDKILSANFVSILASRLPTIAQDKLQYELEGYSTKQDSPLCAYHQARNARCILMHLS